MTPTPAPDAVQCTREWLERLVIGLNLCPFAAAPFRAGRIAYPVCDEVSPDAIYRAFLDALLGLVQADPRIEETALLILSQGLADFDDYLDVLAQCEEAIDRAGLSGVVQVAGFHPQYRFAGVPADDPANHSNRSPFPMFHLIREDGLAAALESFPDPERIPERNIRRLRELGTAGIRARLQAPSPADR